MGKITVSYKKYPYAPKATRASMLISLWFSAPALILYVFFGNTAIGKILFLFEVPSFIAGLISFASVLVIGVALFIWKKKKESKIELAAKQETITVLSMSKEEKQEYDKELAKDKRQNNLLMFCVIIGVIILWEFIT